VTGYYKPKMTGTRVIARRNAQGVISEMTLNGDAFMRSLAAALTRIDATTTAQLWTIGLRVQNTARTLCAVDTGRLRASIMATKGEDARGAFVDIGTNVEYAIYVEFGTRYMAAQPYLRPALAEAAGMWSARVAV
jgi:HK97 gp10 family phage protein